MTHEMQFAREIGDRIVVMDQGRTVEQGPPSEVSLRPPHPRTRALLSRSGVLGERPTPDDEPAG